MWGLLHPIAYFYCLPIRCLSKTAPYRVLIKKATFCRTSKSTHLACLGADASFEKLRMGCSYRAAGNQLVDHLASWPAGRRASSPTASRPPGLPGPDGRRITQPTSQNGEVATYFRLVRRLACEKPVATKHERARAPGSLHCALQPDCDRSRLLAANGYGPPSPDRPGKTVN